MINELTTSHATAIKPATLLIKSENCFNPVNDINSSVIYLDSDWTSKRVTLSGSYIRPQCVFSNNRAFIFINHVCLLSGRSACFNLATMCLQYVTLIRPYMYILLCVHTRNYIITHHYTHTTHIVIVTQSQTHTHTHTQSHIGRHIHTLAHMYTIRHHTHTHIHTYAYTYKLVCICVCTVNNNYTKIEIYNILLENSVQLLTILFISS